jgi:hypothetical protein
MMERNLILEDQERYRESYLAWKEFLANRSISGPNLAKPEVQKIFFPSYVHYVRTLFLLAENDKTLKNPKALVEAAGKLIVNLEYSKSPEGWQIAGPHFEKMFMEKKFEKLKHRQKALRLKTSSLDGPRPRFARDRALAGPRLLVANLDSRAA